MECMGCRQDCHSLGFNGLCGTCSRVYEDRLASQILREKRKKKTEPKKGDRVRVTWKGQKRTGTVFSQSYGRTCVTIDGDDKNYRVFKAGDVRPWRKKKKKKP